MSHPAKSMLFANSTIFCFDKYSINTVNLRDVSTVLLLREFCTLITLRVICPCWFIYMNFLFILNFFNYLEWNNKTVWYLNYILIIRMHLLFLEMLFLSSI